MTAQEFERKANFPHCLGAVDGKHIQVMKPEHSSSMFYNYKDFFPLYQWPWQTLTTALCMLTLVVTEKTDSTIFKRSTLWTSIQTNMLELPSERPLSGTEAPNVPYFFVDEGFALNRNLLRPFGGYNLSVKKRVYNYRLCRARRYVECAF